MRHRNFQVSGMKDLDGLRIGRYQPTNDRIKVRSGQFDLEVVQILAIGLSDSNGRASVVRIAFFGHDVTCLLLGMHGIYNYFKGKCELSAKGLKYLQCFRVSMVHRPSRSKDPKKEKLAPPRGFSNNNKNFLIIIITSTLNNFYFYYIVHGTLLWGGFS